MSTSELHEPLERLRTEIKKLGEDDEAIKQRMKGLVADLERKLESSGEDSEHESLVESLRENVERFEVEHPRLTAVLNQVMVSLSNMGI